MTNSVCKITTDFHPPHIEVIMQVANVIYNRNGLEWEMIHMPSREEGGIRESNIPYKPIFSHTDIFTVQYKVDIFNWVLNLLLLTSCSDRNVIGNF